MSTTALEIAFGRRTFPADVAAVWGARLIWPNDLLHDRQDLAATNDEAKAALIAWLNGEPAGKGALYQALEALRDPRELGLRSDTPFEEEAVIFEDERGKIVGSPQGPSGYLYVAGWLK